MCRVVGTVDARAETKEEKEEAEKKGSSFLSLSLSPPHLSSIHFFLLAHPGRPLSSTFPRLSGDRIWVRNETWAILRLLSSAPAHSKHSSCAHRRRQTGAKKPKSKPPARRSTWPPSRTPVLSSPSPFPWLVCLSLHLALSLHTRPSRQITKGAAQVSRLRRTTARLFAEVLHG